MVSDDTRERTHEMLEQGGWFGMEEGQITLMKQEKVAAIQVGRAFKTIRRPVFERNLYRLDSQDVGEASAVSSLVEKLKSALLNTLPEHECSDLCCYTRRFAVDDPIRGGHATSDTKIRAFPSSP